MLTRGSRAGEPEVLPWSGESRLDWSATSFDWSADTSALNMSASSMRVINVSATVERMRRFRDQGMPHACGNSSAFLSRLRLGVLTQRDLLEYAGLKSRQQLVRDCSTVDPDTGRLVSCLADEVRLACFSRPHLSIPA